MNRSFAFTSAIPAAILLLVLGMVSSVFAQTASTRVSTIKKRDATPRLRTSKPTHGHPTSGVYYEIFVRSFYDSNGDGIGDLNGVTQKLGYLKWLGVSGIWLMPINPSPSYHGYDVTHYRAINPQYGTMQDFKHLLTAAHRLGIKVIIDLVINHTSNRNPWFKAAQNPHSPYRNWYHWAGSKTHLKAISVVGGPVWRADGKQHYMGIFCPCMPDLNYNNPAVRHEMIAIGRFWLRKGVDGFRLDAARHLYVKRPSQVHNPVAVGKDIAWWRQFRQGIDRVNPHAYLIGEVTDNDYRQMAPYFKPLNATFDFPLAQRLIKMAAKERNDHLGATLVAIQKVYRAATGHYVQDAPFLSNHDQNRVMSDLHGNLNHMRVAAQLLLTLPGNPFIYYGEAIGMRGVKPDPHLREPMRWELSRSAPGETTWEASPIPAAEDVSVAAERKQPGSLLRLYRTLIHWRQQIAPLRDGVVARYPISNPAIVTYRLSDPEAQILVVHNLSGQSHTVDLLAHRYGRFDSVLRKTRTNIRLNRDSLEMPPYSTAILEAHHSGIHRH